MIQYWTDLPNTVRSYKAGSAIFHQSDKIISMFLVIRGEARLIRRNRNGDALILQRATAGSIIAEASLFAGSYHCDAVAYTDIKLAILPRNKVKQKFASDTKFARAWAEHLAQEVRAARLRAEILSLKTVSQRLSAWTANYGPLPARGTWKSLAQELGTSAEALYREIAKRKSKSLTS